MNAMRTRRQAVSFAIMNNTLLDGLNVSFIFLTLVKPVSLFLTYASIFVLVSLFTISVCSFLHHNSGCIGHLHRAITLFLTLVLIITICMMTCWVKWTMNIIIITNSSCEVAIIMLLYELFLRIWHRVVLMYIFIGSSSRSSSNSTNTTTTITIIISSKMFLWSTLSWLPTQYRSAFGESWQEIRPNVS